METIFLLRILIYEITEDKNCAFYECGGVLELSALSDILFL